MNGGINNRRDHLYKVCYWVQVTLHEEMQQQVMVVGKGGLESAVVMVDGDGTCPALPILL